MKDFFKTVLRGLHITCIGFCGVSMDCLGVYLITKVSKAEGWWAILVLLASIGLISLSIMAYWGVGLNIEEPVVHKEATDDRSRT